MKKSLLLFFIICWTISALLTKGALWKISDHYYSTLKSQTSIIGDSIKERFKLYLNSSYIIGIFAADHFSDLGPDHFEMHRHAMDEYHRLGTMITKNFPEILGLNFLNQQGKITNVFPTGANQGAQDKISQNISAIKESYNRGESFWFSPPFDLFQGSKGFAFYVPIHQENKILMGWLAVVINSESFFERLNLKNYLQKNHLLIKDVASGNDFFSTSQFPLDPTKVKYQRQISIFGRTIRMAGWSKNDFFGYHISWYYCLIISFFFTVLMTFSYFLYLQRAETKKQLRKINTLIRYTAQEASFTLTNFYKEINLMGKGTGYVSADKMAKYVSYISTLLEQITISERFNHTAAQPEFQHNQVYPILIEQLELFQEKLLEKNVVVNIEEDSKEYDFKVWSNKWLLCHSVIGNIMRYLLFYAPVGSHINMTLQHDKEYQYVSFQGLLSETAPENDEHAEIMNKCLSIAREVVKISHGEVDIIERPLGSRTIVLKFLKA